MNGPLLVEASLPRVDKAIEGGQAGTRAVDEAEFMAAMEIRQTE